MNASENLITYEYFVIACNWTLIDDGYMSFGGSSTLSVNKWKEFFELLGLASFTTLKTVVKTLHKSDLVKFLSFTISFISNLKNNNFLLNRSDGRKFFCYADNFTDKNGIRKREKT